MDKLFVSYKIAVLLKAKGFDEECIAEYFNEQLTFYKNRSSIGSGERDILSTHKNSKPNHITEELAFCAPLYQQVIDWLCEKHNIKLNFNTEMNGDSLVSFCHLTKDIWKGHGITISDKDYYKAYNRAIEKALNLI